MREGGIAAGFFAIFVPARDDEPADPALLRRTAGRLRGAAGGRRSRSSGPRGWPPSSPRSPSATSTPSATSPSSSAASPGRPGRDPPPRGRRAGRAGARQPRGLGRARRALDRHRVEPAERVRPRRPVSLPRHARHRARADRRRPRARARVQQARRRRRPRHLTAAGFGRRALSSAPLVVSHAGERARPIPRSLTDAQLDAVRASGGLVGSFFDRTMTHPRRRSSPTRRSTCCRPRGAYRGAHGRRARRARLGLRRLPPPPPSPTRRGRSPCSRAWPARAGPRTTSGSRSSELAAGAARHLA